MPFFDSIVEPPKPIVRRSQPVSSSTTDRGTLKQNLAEAEGHMAMSKGHIASQREFVSGLVRNGHDASQALALLLRFEELQQLHIVDRDRLRGELGK
jgi:hypothetical protein